MPVPLTLPMFHSEIETILIDRLSISVGQRVEPGTELLICTVDFGGAEMHDCPLETSYTVLAAESATVQDIYVTLGSRILQRQPIALVETDGTSDGTLRVMTAAIIHAEFW